MTCKEYETKSGKPIRLWRGDCMELMEGKPENNWDLAIVDPPYFKGVADKNFYGSDVSTTGVKRLSSESNKWDNNIPTESYFNPLLCVSKNHIVWGCNYYPYCEMPSGRLIWDKKMIHQHLVIVR